MQSASSNFSQAMSGFSGTWAAPQITADWVGDGVTVVRTGDVMDTFARSASGGWGAADTGQIWTTANGSATDYAVAAGVGTHSHTSVNVRRTTTISAGSVDCDETVDVMLAVGSPTGAAITQWVTGRSADTSNYYGARLDVEPSGTVTLLLIKRVGGSLTSPLGPVAVTVGTGHSSGDWWRVRLQVQGSPTATIRAKAWMPVASSEPAAWTLTTTDSDLTAGTNVNLQSRLETGNTNTQPVVVSWARFLNGCWDDLSGQVGSPISVHQALDDGLPSDVTYTSSVDSTSSVSFPVGGRVGLRPEQYWSQDNGASPISNYDRDVAAVTVAHGPVTAGGIERVTVFTGQMSDAPISGRSVSADAVSAARLKLTTRIQPPPIIGDNEGLTATWPVSYALHKSGLHASPPPRAGCRLWLPMHGSTHPMVPDDFTGATGFMQDLHNPDLPNVRPTFVSGPFVAGVFAQVNAGAGLLFEVNTLGFAPGTDVISKAANVGRIEMWMRGDPADANAAWGAIGFIGDNLLFFQIKNTNGTYVKFGVTSSARKPYITVFDGTTTVTLTSTAAIPSDGAWYSIGAAWDIAGKTLWTYSNATVTSTGAGALVTSGLPTADTYDRINFFPQFDSWVPVAEVQVSGGTQASPSSAPAWIADAGYAWTLGAVVRPSILSLTALAEPAPVEAAAFIADYAQAELASTRTDELDRFCYLPMSYWAESVQQTTVDTISTAANAGADLAPSRDLTKIRNQVVANYADTRISNLVASFLGDALISFTVYALSPGITTLKLTFIGPIVQLAGLNFYLITAADVTAGNGPNQNFICANTAADGSGSFATSAQITATIASWNPGGATITVVNSSSTTYYTANTGVVPYIDIKGSMVVATDASATIEDNVSILMRGVRGLTADLKAIQDARLATFIANELAARLRRARRQVTVTVRGDPRRQPGDLVRLADPNYTNIGGLWRILTVDHTIDGANYIQTLSLIEAALIGVWGQSTWTDGSIWGP